MNVRHEVKVAAVFLGLVAAALLVTPWLLFAYEQYLDWQYCATHPYLETSWSENPHHCTPVGSTR